MNDQINLPDDARIIDLYWARDEQAIYYTDAKYKAYLISAIKHILSDLRDREECLNDTYIGAWNSMPPQRPKVLPAYLCTIARRKAIDTYRKTRSKKAVPETLMLSFEELGDYAAYDPTEVVEQQAKELGKLINAYVGTLDDRKRYVFISRYFYAQPIDEIANMLGISKGTLNREIAQIKSTLRAFLAKEGYIL